MSSLRCTLWECAQFKTHHSVTGCDSILACFYDLGDQTLTLNMVKFVLEKVALRILKKALLISYTAWIFNYFPGYNSFIHGVGTQRRFLANSRSFFHPSRPQNFVFSSHFQNFHVLLYITLTSLTWFFP